MKISGLQILNLSRKGTLDLRKFRGNRDKKAFPLFVLPHSFQTWIHGSRLKVIEDLKMPKIRRKFMNRNKWNPYPSSAVILLLCTSLLTALISYADVVSRARNASLLFDTEFSNPLTNTEVSDGQFFVTIGDNGNDTYTWNSGEANSLPEYRESKFQFLVNKKNGSGDNQRLEDFASAQVVTGVNHAGENSKMLYMEVQKYDPSTTGSKS